MVATSCVEEHQRRRWAPEFADYGTDPRPERHSGLVMRTKDLPRPRTSAGPSSEARAQKDLPHRFQRIPSTFLLQRAPRLLVWVGTGTSIRGPAGRAGSWRSRETEAAPMVIEIAGRTALAA
jgi:hypothetical protein